MENKPFNDVSIPSWIERTHGKNCPICKSILLKEIQQTGSDPLKHEWHILCTNCGTIFDEAKWSEAERRKILNELEDEVPVNDLEAQPVNKPNLIILRSNMLLEPESFETVVRYIHQNIKNGVLLLPGYIDFVGAYEVDEEFRAKLYNSDAVIQPYKNSELKRKEGLYESR
jgi:hypothetical protein